MKFQIDLKIENIIRFNDGYGIIKLSLPSSLNLNILPGQFTQVKVPNSSETFLRRPISICNVEKSSISLLIRKAGAGTRHLIDMQEGELLNLILPLGNGFYIPQYHDKSFSPLLVGGGVGVAPLLYYGKKLNELGYSPKFLLAAKNEQQLLLIDEFKNYGDIYISTDDGTCGERGLVTENSILKSGCFNRIACCGPIPMMKAVAKIAKVLNVECEVSLENLMGCGIGACLCCVEDTIDKGNVCVCKEGPVFNINRLKW